MIANRKDDHVRLAAEQQRHHSGYNQFDDVSFVHHALAGIGRSGVRCDVLIHGALRSFCADRGIETRQLATRSSYPSATCKATGSVR